MPDCAHPRCKREDLPTSPAMPPGVGATCAHVNAHGEPCPFSTPYVYDADLKAIIVTEDGLWDSEFRAESAAGSDNANLAGDGSKVRASAAAVDSAPVAVPDGKRRGRLLPAKKPPAPLPTKTRRPRAQDQEDVDDWQP